ncbi:hypothetical protein [Microcoleus sp. FACHB-672]|uniref:hypothetical protein n=1 Tax=Microcoleus sp. FACHB-672 TaxID=2692825 RepID=UPI0016889CC4|nr:hypothetical protein [Microcoleus sp. FACHB-672]MBD2039112.1 hypothetical protein [Microcoleus sp. FACHB-672]
MLPTKILGICIPLPAVINGEAVLPIGVITNRAAGTAVLWHCDKKSHNTLPENQLQQPEERLTNLETIAGTDDSDLCLRLKQAESTIHNL